MSYLKEEAESQPEINDPHFVPFEKKTRGSVFKAKERSKSSTPLLPDDLSDVLDAASEDDLLELAGTHFYFINILYKKIIILNYFELCSSNKINLLINFNSTKYKKA